MVEVVVAFVSSSTKFSRTPSASHGHRPVARGARGCIEGHINTVVYATTPPRVTVTASVPVPNAADVIHAVKLWLALTVTFANAVFRP